MAAASWSGLAGLQVLLWHKSPPETPNNQEPAQTQVLTSSQRVYRLLDLLRIPHRGKSLPSLLDRSSLQFLKKWRSQTWLSPQKSITALDRIIQRASNSPVKENWWVLVLQNPQTGHVLHTKCWYYVLTLSPVLAITVDFDDFVYYYYHKWQSKQGVL